MNNKKVEKITTVLHYDCLFWFYSGEVSYFPFSVNNHVVYGIPICSLWLWLCCPTERRRCLPARTSWDSSGLQPEHLGSGWRRLQRRCPWFSHPAVNRVWRRTCRESMWVIRLTGTSLWKLGVRNATEQKRNLRYSIFKKLIDMVISLVFKGALPIGIVLISEIICVSLYIICPIIGSKCGNRTRVVYHCCPP